MDYKFTGKNLTIADTTKAKVTQKLDRIERMFPDNTDVYVTLATGKNDFTVEVTIPIANRNLRAEVSAPDMQMAIDEVVDILEKQIVKYKGRLRSRSNRDARFMEEMKNFATSNEEGEQGGIKIEKMKKFALKPMDAEEAAMELEMLGHNFYVFRNGDTDEVNVVYKRKDGAFGLIEPEF